MRQFVPATDDVVQAIREAIEQGRILMVLPASQINQHVICEQANADIDHDHVATYSAALRLTKSEARAIMKLVDCGSATKQMIHAAIARDDCPTTGVRIVDVVISSARRKLAPRGIEIVTLYGIGYRLTEEGRERIHEIITAHGADIAVPP
jgi:DNA-binding response OmpR family regulator